ncbi:Predicted phosphodiesterase [Catalinimonas alkaloidigena]|uniref:Predicted phosphodiesterase n=1 Tax=Catalinimonas alkaloidigena TaxID=1075417 RepID=A0A1G9THX9_9BACT|nr:metallophosphoesterase family protein [Catalinimonas alkaloidigena]SDM47337.1 Predicted phosphodiesterase [Catalinimonas alkaloidigena]
MLLALFSDIHGNLPALEAVLADLDQRQPDAIYCLGDLVGYAPWPNEVIREIRRRRIPTLAGNYDEGIGLHSDDCGCAYKTDEDKAMGAVSIRCTNAWVEEAERRYLRTLPRHMRLELELQPRAAQSDKLQLLMVHGSPRRINEYLFEDRREESLLRTMEQAQADILFLGHTHKPYHRKLAYEVGEETRFRHAINIGSVGKPKDGDPRACYVLVRLEESLSRQDPASVEVTFVRVAYDVEKAAKAVEQSPLPDAYAQMLRRAY